MKRSHLHLLLLVLLVPFIAALSLSFGAVPIPLGRMADILFGESSTASSPDALILWQLRLPRLALACLIGGGLGASGAGFQGLFRNPLADPFVIGASGGAALGATLAIVYGRPEALGAAMFVSLAALVGATAAVLLVYTIASAGGHAPIHSLLLAGVTISSLLGSLVSLVMFLHDEKLSTIFGWLMGSLSARGWSTVSSAAPLIGVAVVGLWLCSRSLDALSFGDETAASLGLRHGRSRALIVLFAALATAASVSAGGIIGFVGLLAPHAARRLVGARHALVIPAAAALGAILLLIADALARSVMPPGELPVGVVMSLLGSPFFLFLLKARPQHTGGAA